MDSNGEVTGRPGTGQGGAARAEVAGVGTARGAPRTGMQHLTLDTGHTRVSFADEVDPRVLDQLRPLTVTGTHPMPRPPGCTVSVAVDGTAALVTVMRAGDPLVTFGVAADERGAAKLWPLIARLGVAQPSAVPWLAVGLEVGVAAHPGDLGWLGDFERCWAWCWLNNVRQDIPLT
jgi:hypothetical protein